jgi:hypothetical protein
MINRRHAYIAMFAILLAMLSCDREAIIATQSEAIELKVRVTPSVVEYGGIFTVRVEIANLTEHVFTVRSCSMPFYFCVMDETGDCWNTVSANCIPGEEPDVYEFTPFSITEPYVLRGCGAPFPCLIPGRYIIKARIEGLFSSGISSSDYDEAVLIVQ